MDATARVLVCYASAAGSTREIAQRIADRIRSELSSSGVGDAEVLCVPAGPDVHVRPSDALIVGSAVHSMAWLPAATALLGRAGGAAAAVWVFSVGSVEAHGPLTRMLLARERVRIEQAFPPDLAVRQHRIFRGVVVMAGVPLWGRLFWRLIGGRAGDQRNWPAIDAWATGIAAEWAALREASPLGSAAPGSENE